MSKYRTRFIYGETKIEMSCYQNDFIRDICLRFQQKNNLKDEDIIYVSNSIIIDIRSNIKFINLAPSSDILEINVYINYQYQIPQNQANENNENQIKENSIQELSKSITCPKCHEESQIKIKDYQITLYGCKNNHSVENILLNEYEQTQIPNNNISNDWEEKESNLKKKFHKFFNSINNFIKILNRLKENMKIYYNIYNNFNGDSDDIDEDNFNKDLNDISEEMKPDKFKTILNIYGKMELNNKIKINYFF